MLAAASLIAIFSRIRNIVLHTAVGVSPETFLLLLLQVIACHASDPLTVHSLQRLISPDRLIRHSKVIMISEVATLRHRSRPAQEAMNVSKCAHEY
jgi:hypothetical protein